MKDSDLILSKVILETLPNDAKVEILGHFFQGVDEIRKAVEIRGTVMPDFGHKRDLHNVKPEKPVNGIHVLELYQPYPCFDSSDSLYENRRYYNFFFSNTPFSDEMINGIVNLKKGPNYCMVNEQMNPGFLPAVYFEGDSRHKLLVAKSVSITIKDVLAGNWIIDKNKSLITESYPNSWEERYAVLKHFTEKNLYIKISTEEVAKQAGLNYFRENDYKFMDPWQEFECRLTPKGNMIILGVYAWPWRGSSDSEYLYRVYDPTGNPLTYWRSSWGRLSNSGYFDTFKEN